MKALAELDLPHLPVETAEFAADPVRYFNEAKTRHPWIAGSDIGYFVHEYTAIRELLIEDDMLRPAYDGVVEQLGVHGTPWGRFTEEQLVSLPAEQHRLVRDTFATKFTPRHAKRLRPVMRETITRLLDEWTPSGKMDFEEMASYFPISVMFTLVGAPVAEIAGIRSSLEALGLALSMDKSRVPEIDAAYRQLEEMSERLISDRRADPDGGHPDDLLSLLIDTGDDGGITPRQLTDLLIFFFIAGYDTSKNVLTHTMYMMLDRPEIYQRCAVDHEYCRKVLDEGLRYFNPGSVPRFAANDIVFRDVLLPKDTMLWFTLNVSGRDPGSFHDPDRFDPDRVDPPGKRHIAFSVGKHMCLGQFIARAQLQEALHLIPQRILDPRLDGPIGWRPYPGAWGMKGLPISFNPA